jgi:hypothetical protein
MSEWWWGGGGVLYGRFYLDGTYLRTVVSRGPPTYVNVGVDPQWNPNSRNRTFYTCRNSQFSHWNQINSEITVHSHWTFSLVETTFTHRTKFSRGNHFHFRNHLRSWKPCSLPESLFTHGKFISLVKPYSPVETTFTFGNSVYLYLQKSRSLLETVFTRRNHIHS